MDIAKAVAATLRGMGLTTKQDGAGAKPAAPEPIPQTMSPAETRVQRANLQILQTARATLERTIALLK